MTRHEWLIAALAAVTSGGLVAIMAIERLAPFPGCSGCLCINKRECGKPSCACEIAAKGDRG